MGRTISYQGVLRYKDLNSIDDFVNGMMTYAHSKGLETRLSSKPDKYDRRGFHIVLDEDNDYIHFMIECTKSDLFVVDGFTKIGNYEDSEEKIVEVLKVFSKKYFADNLHIILPEEEY